MNDALIEIAHVEKVYHRDALEIPVLNDVNLKVPEGEFVALMGPSGSGKTTLLNLIAGIDKPTRGRIVIGGRDISQMSQSELARWRSSPPPAPRWSSRAPCSTTRRSGRRLPA